MKLLKQVGSRQRNIESAQDVLCAMAAVPGFVFGYVDESIMSCVSFHRVADSYLHPGQQMVDVAVGEPESIWNTEGWPLLAPIGEALLASKSL